MKRTWWITALVILGACGGTSGAVVGQLPRNGQGLLETTSEVRPTTTVPPEKIEPTTLTVAADLESSFAELMQARIECGRDPYSCDVATFTEVNSPIYSDLQQLIAERRSAHITATGGGAIRYRIDKTQTLSDSSALVYTCITDDVVLVDGDIIFDDSMMSSLVTFTLVKVDDQWLWNQGTPTRWTTEEDLCDFDA
ncbi:unannotated protein [freshwater metagenome]|nr:hypothetical protein [Actinomycetota bacterium]MSX16182.1 hypothetical protein [Actinomycetota bacterium]MSZ71234.1 hypothetical protein [Actinomycetota bacterium]MUH55920.1 hypothetical protein [Actinomycetota bacterium]